eukprot:767594-Hanusia_phi.AAC.8
MEGAGEEDAEGKAGWPLRIGKTVLALPPKAEGDMDASGSQWDAVEGHGGAGPGVEGTLSARKYFREHRDRVMLREWQSRQDAYGDLAFLISLHLSELHDPTSSSHPAIKAMPEWLVAILNYAMAEGPSPLNTGRCELPWLFEIFTNAGFKLNEVAFRHFLEFLSNLADGKLFSFEQKAIEMEDVRQQLRLELDYDDTEIRLSDLEIEQGKEKNAESISVKLFVSLNEFIMGMCLTKLWIAGMNENGQLGDGGDYNVANPKSILIRGRLKCIGCGGSRALVCVRRIFASKEGDSENYQLGEVTELLVTGRNQYGELGLGHKSNQHVFTAVPSFSNIPVRMIACGEFHTLVMTEDKRVFGCGWNRWGQLGLGDTVDRESFCELTEVRDPLMISCGAGFSLVLCSKGEVLSCGNNMMGQLGLGFVGTGRYPFFQGDYAQDNSESSSYCSKPLKVEILRGKIRSVCCGGLHALALSADGTESVRARARPVESRFAS